MEWHRLGHTESAVVLKMVVAKGSLGRVISKRFLLMAVIVTIIFLTGRHCSVLSSTTTASIELVSGWPPCLPPCLAAGLQAPPLDCSRT